MRKLLSYLVLPREIGSFEARHLDRMNRVALWFFVLHVPALVGLAALNGTGALAALLLASLALVGPAVGYVRFENPRALARMYGFTAMAMGALLVHFGRGALQTQMHFYFFALLGLLAAFADPLVIVTAAATLVVHHLALWAWLPSSLLGPSVSLTVVLVHLTFVVLASAAACFIARAFFDFLAGIAQLVQGHPDRVDVRQRPDLRPEPAAV